MDWWTEMFGGYRAKLGEAIEASKSVIDQQKGAVEAFNNDPIKQLEDRKRKEREALDESMKRTAEQRGNMAAMSKRRASRSLLRGSILNSPLGQPGGTSPNVGRKTILGG